MLDIIKEYNCRVQESRMKCDEIDKKIENARERIATAERYIAKLEKKRVSILFAESWVEGIVCPLAERLSARIGLDYKVYGPFGLRCETTIYFVKDMTKRISEQETRSITLIPRTDKDGNYVVYYETGEVDDSYQKDSIGYLNGMHRKIASLPEAIEEIEDLLFVNRV